MADNPAASDVTAANGEVNQDELSKGAAEQKAEETKANPAATEAVKDTDTDAARDADEAEKEDGRRKPGRREERIRQLIEQRNAERAARYAAEARLRALEQHRAEIEDDLDPLNFDSDADYLKAATEATAQKVREQILREQMYESERRAQMAAAAAWNERVGAFKERAPDFEEVVYRPDFHQTPAMVEAILDSEIGPQIAYYLAKNSAEANRIAALPPLQAAREIGRLEHRLSMAAAKRTTQAPAPAKTISAANSGSQPKPYSEMSVAEYFEARQKALRNRGA